jgi:integrase
VAWGLVLCQADERLAEKAEPVYQELVEALRDSVAVHADETGWRVGGQGAWLWVFTGPRGPSTPSIGAGPMRWWWRSWDGRSGAWGWLTGDASVAN